MDICSVPGCGLHVKQQKFCSRHYSRFRLHGDPLGGGPDRRLSTGECSVAGCDNQDTRHGLCSMHYQRKRRLGSLDVVTRPQRYRSDEERLAAKQAARRRYYEKTVGASK